MLSIRIVAAGAVFLFMMAGSALAQTATSAAPGKPMPLLKILAKPDKTKPKPHGKRVSKRAGKTHVAAARRKPRHPAETATAAASASIWPAPQTAMTTDLAAAEPEQQPAAAANEPVPSELIVGGRTVQIVSPDNANEIDLAADAPKAAATTAPRTDIAEAAPAAEAAADGAAVAQTREDASPVGSASWIAHVLAALGGAVAAGSIAWFLIGSAPQRTYG